MTFYKAGLQGNPYA